MYSSISSNDLKGMIGKVNIIDLRDNYLYRLGNIPSSKNIPYKYLMLLPEKYLDKDKTYYLYCTQGMQSAKVCSKLSRLGYKVVNVLGGYNDYISK